MNIQDHVESKIVAMIREKAARITSGNCRSYEDYRAACGELVGLDQAMRLARQALTEVLKSDDGWTDIGDE